MAVQSRTANAVECSFDKFKRGTKSDWYLSKAYELENALFVDWYSVLSYLFLVTIINDFFSEIWIRLGLNRPNKAREQALRRRINKYFNPYILPSFSFL